MPLVLACAAMGTRFELVLGGGPEGFLRAAGEAALEELTLLHRAWNAFARDSLLSHLARTAGQAPTRVDEETMSLLLLAREVGRASNLAFNPLLFPLKEGSTPPAGLDEALFDLEGLELDIAQGTARLARPGMALDLGAIAKGAALDVAGRVLLEHGVESALLHGGTSSVLALGPPPGSPCWRIALGHGKAAPRVLLAHGALSLSARCPARAKERAHILDGRSLEPARGPFAAAVLSSSGAGEPGPCAALVDAWSTALVAGCAPELLPEHLSCFLQSSAHDPFSPRLAHAHA